MSRGSYVVALLAERYTVTISPAVSTHRIQQTDPYIVLERAIEMVHVGKPCCGRHNISVARVQAAAAVTAEPGKW